MKIALIAPPIPKKFKLPTDYLSLGLVYLGTALQEDHEVRLIDGFNRDYSVKEILDQIRDFEPDILGVSLLFDAMIIHGREIIQEIKNTYTDLPILGGGPYATLNSTNLIKENLFDVIVMHEGEVTTVELIKAFEQQGELNRDFLTNIDGLCFLDQEGQVTYSSPRPLIEDLDELSFPNYDLLGVATNEIEKINIISSRGCGHSCIYCSTDKMWKNKWRGRSAENIVAEIAQFPKIKSVNFVDDNFTKSRKRVKEFCRLLIERGIKIKWSCSTRAESLTDELIDLMSKSGCTNIFLGVESGSERILKFLKRGYTKQQIIDLSERCLEKGILVKASFIVGFPYEKPEDIKETMDLIKKIQTNECAVHIFTPRIGTVSFEEPEKFDLTIHSSDTHEITEDLQGMVSTSELSVEEINEWYMKTIGITYRKRRQKAYYDDLIRKNREELEACMNEK